MAGSRAALRVPGATFAAPRSACGASSAATPTSIPRTWTPAARANALTLAAFGSLLLLSGAKPAQAQSNIVYTANIPFAFQMNDATLPAGTYRITQDSPHSLRLSQANGMHPRYVNVYAGDDAKTERAQIRFTRYGERTFLRDFATSADGSPHRSVSRCAVTPGEKRAAKDWVQTRQTFFQATS